MKKIVSVILAVILIMIPMTSLAKEVPESLITVSDLQIITSDFVMANIYNNENCTWNTSMKAKETPLYGMDDNINSYYVAFNNEDGTPNGYLVVNASVNNPSVLEYAFGTKHEEIAEGKKNYYATFGTYLTKEFDQEKNCDVFKSKGETLSLVSQAKDKINGLWKKINKKNDQAVIQLKKRKDNAAMCSLSTSIMASTTNLNSEWNILTSLPSGSWSSYDILSSCSLGVPYYTTYEFSNYTNHCGATAAINVLKYYGARLSYDFIKPNKESAFNYLYVNTGNGNLTLPTTLLSGLNSYIKNRKNNGYLPSNVQITTYQYTDLYYNNMKSCINNGKMPMMNIWSGLNSHWVNIVAYYLYSNGNCYVRIINNWDNDINKYYLFQTGYEINGLIGSLIAAKITK